MKRWIALMLLLFVVGCGAAGTNHDEGSAAGDAGDGAGDAVDSGNVPTLAFHLEDAVGIVGVSDQYRSMTMTKGGEPLSTNYGKLLSDGTVDEFVESDSPLYIGALWISPDGSLYVSLDTAYTLNDEPCILLRVSRDNSYQCIDAELLNINESNGINDWIQFDSAGNIYYSGLGNGGNTILRRWNAAVGSTDLINENIYLQRFLVVSDGSAYIYGRSEPTSSRFIRRVGLSNELMNVLLGDFVNELLVLSGGVYIANSTATRVGVHRIVDDALSETMLIGDPSQESGYDVDFHISQNRFGSCEHDGRYEQHKGFCQTGGAKIRQLLRTPAGLVYAVVGYGDDNSLWKYYPEVEPIDTSIYRPLLVRSILDELIVSGYDQDGVNRFIIYNPTQGQEIDLLGDENIEIYHFDYSQSGLIYFDGLRFSDNQYVIGAIDTTDGNRLIIFNTSTVPYEDLMLFQ